MMIVQQRQGISFQERLALYRRVEHVIAQALRQRYSVIVTGDLPGGNHHGPRLSGNGKQITVADLQVYGKRKGWIEIKTKGKPWKYEKYNRLEHGIDLVKWEHYWRLQQTTGLTVYLMVIEEDSGAVLMRDLDSIQAFGDVHTGEWPPPDCRPSINFDRCSLAKVGSVNWKIQRAHLDFDVLDSFLSQLALFDSEELRS